ncbi:MAG: indole-3-glycerol phosphate synthase TrpC [Firmicutes bacterium]|nr:indole-3-glycerol phosphate synthase TrpC [Bacillota bacterium]
MSTILDQLADYARYRVEKAKEKKPLEEIREEALAASRQTAPGPGTSAPDFREPFRFEKALAADGDIHFICECKKASPSKGLIALDFPYLEIARQYEEAGASAISVLTEPKWFLGSPEYLREIAEEVKVPCLRKDFTVDPYMIYEAKLLGASAVLLICAILDTGTLAEYLEAADSLGLSAIVEAHDETEVASAVSAGARIIGVNNRNLKDFTVDIHNSIRLRSCAPEGTIFVAESGIRTPEDVETLRQNGVNAVLIGEQLMRAGSPKEELNRLRGLT